MPSSASRFACLAGGTVREDGLDVAEHFTIEYSDGRYAQCASSMADFTELSASVSGPRGWLTVSAPFWASTGLEIHAGSAEKIFHAPDAVHFPREGSGYIPMLRAVIAAIASGVTEHPVHTAAETLAVMHTIDEIFAQIR